MHLMIGVEERILQDFLMTESSGKIPICKNYAYETFVAIGNLG